MTKITNIDLALAQVLGFAHCKEGYSIEDLIDGMGLTMDEWQKMKEDKVFMDSTCEDILHQIEYKMFNEN